MRADWLTTEPLLSQSQTPTAIQSDCLTAPWAVDIGDRLLIGFGKGKGAGVRPQHKLTHVTEYFSSQHTIVFQRRTIR